VFTADKAIKYSDLVAFTSLEEARGWLMDKEIENVMRLSHQKQMIQIEDWCKIKLRDGLAVWPQFIEICERRNVLTHTGGIVSGQYKSACKEARYDATDPPVGTKLSVGPAYFSDAVNVVHEVGVRLCYALWRKLIKDDQNKAGERLDRLCYKLICQHVYGVAESVLAFASEHIKKSGKDDTRRRMIVNLANAVRLQGRDSEALAILDREDWSATSYSYRLCVAAVKVDVDTVVTCMHKIGRGGEVNAEDYRTWPVFRGIKSDERFIKAFESIFSEPFIMLRAADAK
jgi:hypothetical protein